MLLALYTAERTALHVFFPKPKLLRPRRASAVLRNVCAPDRHDCAGSDFFRVKSFFCQHRVKEWHLQLDPTVFIFPISTPSRPSS